MTTCKTIISKPARARGKRLVYGFLGGLALFTAVALFTGCGKKQEQDEGKNEKKQEQDEGKNEKKQEQTEYEKGTAALEKGDRDAAFQCFEKGAVSDARAKLMLSMCYAFSIGVEGNEEKTIQLLEEAAGAGDEYAMFLYGLGQISQGEREKGISYLKKSADKGCVLAIFTQVNLALIDGDFSNYVPNLERIANMPLTDRKSPFDYLPELKETVKRGLNLGLKLGASEGKRAHDSGETFDAFLQGAGEKVGNAISDGQSGIEELESGLDSEFDDLDVEEIIKPTNPTIENILIVQAQVSLGCVYAEGSENLGIKRDKAKAREWFKKAGENGFTEADVVLKDL